MLLPCSRTVTAKRPRDHAHRNENLQSSLVEWMNRDAVSVGSMYSVYVQRYDVLSEESLSSVLVARRACTDVVKCARSPVMSYQACSTPAKSRIFLAVLVPWD